VLPFLLFVRHFRRQLKKKRNVREFIVSSPITLLLLVLWSLGELIGYTEALAGVRAEE
jgi:hypothetical protein